MLEVSAAVVVEPLVEPVVADVELVDPLVEPVVADVELVVEPLVLVEPVVADVELVDPLVLVEPVVEVVVVGA